MQLQSFVSFVPGSGHFNIGRVVALMALVRWQGSAILDTAIHPLSGFISFSLAAFLLFWIDRAASLFARHRP